MQLHNAYNLTVQKVIQLRNSGIEISTACPLITADINHTAEYEISGELPKALWNNVTFCSVSKEQLQQIYEAKSCLLGFGIFFDSGAFIAAERPSPDWQLDWSFRLIDFKEEPDEQ